jgi:hypothetical protein
VIKLGTLVSSPTSYLAASSNSASFNFLPPVVLADCTLGSFRISEGSLFTYRVVPFLSVIYVPSLIILTFPCFVSIESIISPFEQVMNFSMPISIPIVERLVLMLRFISSISQRRIQ